MREPWQVAGNAAETYQEELVPAVFGPWAPRVVELAGWSLDFVFSTLPAGPGWSGVWWRKQLAPMGGSRLWM